MLHQIVDWAITYIESFVMLASVVSICGRRFEGFKHCLLLLLCSTGNSILVAILNSISAFSFITPLVSIAFIFSVSKLLSRGKPLLRVAASVVVHFVVLAIGYIWMIVVCTIHGGEFQEAFTVFMTPGALRSLLLALEKAVEISLYFALRKHMPKLSNLKGRSLGFLFFASIFGYSVTQYLISAILSNDLHNMRQASIVSFFVLLLLFVVFSVLLLTVSSREQERAQHLILQKTDRLMEQNYQLLHKDLQENAKRMHDFHHHLQAILGIAEQSGDEKVKEYVQSLLEISYRDIKLCHSGNDIIDAVINCSAAEADRNRIAFQYDISLSSSLPQISHVDLCAVLGNQVENALEACQRIPADEKRFVNVSIRQHKGFVVLQVTNSAPGNPFDDEGKLVSEKSDPELHGLGIKSIQDTVNKYNGYLTNTYKNHEFISEALLCISTV